MLNRVCVLVLGMHRSGTSVMARMFNLLGAAMPENLVGATEDNERGHWEPSTLNSLHEEMLAAVGSRWDDWRQLTPDNFSADQLAYYKSEIRDVLTREYGEAPLIVLKDPRICRFAWLYEDVLASLGVAPVFVLPHRNPLEVVASLARRDGMTTAFAALLWLRHVLDAELVSRGKRRCFIAYESLMEDWRAVLDDVCTQLAIDWPRLPDDAAEEVEQFLSLELRHHSADTASLRQHPDIADWVKTTYAALPRAACDDSDALMRSMDAVSLEFEHAAAEFGRAIFPELSGREQRMDAELQQQQSKADELLHTVRQQADAAAARLAAVEGELTQARAHVQEQADARVLLEQEHASELALREKHYAELHAHARALEVDRDQARAEETRLHAVLDEVYQSTSWRLTQPVRWVGGSVSAVIFGLRSVISRLVRALWYRLPLRFAHKQRFKRALFRAMPAMFRHTLAYQAWRSFETPAGDYLPVSEREAGDVLLSPTAWQAPAVNYVPLLQATPLANKPVRVVAFYLPQFHPIAENDAWWGKGFTEWTNVRPARPQFAGHYQPHEPGELGYYSLLDRNIQQRQIELARLYGVEGFCFYFYWFAGKRLLETPIENWLRDPELDFPFCLCWANENWTRRWNGDETNVLIAQDHSPEDDIAFIEEVARYLRDPRYIRIDGKPLLLVYRPSLLPSAKKTAARWRRWCRENGIGEIYLAYTQSFENANPRDYDFDAAVEFPPNNSAPPDVTANMQTEAGFSGRIFDWSVFHQRSQNYAPRQYPLFRSVCPGWDNTARRKSGGTIFINNTPPLYQRWLENAIDDTVQHVDNEQERFVFVNAWNEWAEAAYLEPNALTGYAYLQATRNALQNSGSGRGRVLLVSHDAHPHGAQLLALHLAQELGRLGFAVEMIVLGEGSLMPRFAEVARVHRLNVTEVDSEAARKLLQRIRNSGAKLAVVNTALSGDLLAPLKAAGFATVSLIHELPGVLRAYNMKRQARAIVQYADAVVFPADIVRDGFEAFVDARLPQAVIRPQGIYRRCRFRDAEREQVRREVRAQHGLSADARIVLCAGYGDHRKGLDLFVAALIPAMLRDTRIVGMWVGHLDAELHRQQLQRIHAAGLQHRFVFTGRVDDPQPCFFAADLYALTSREDPFPSVVLESLSAAVPVVAFRGTGGAETLLDRGCGVLVAGLDEQAMAEEIVGLLADETRASALAENGRSLVESEFRFAYYLHDLLALGGVSYPRVSVVVPNYNYARHILARLSSITHQRLMPYELIVLDDASTDDSVERIEAYLGQSPIPSRLIVNESNSGSVFRQWLRGVELAKGDYVWIAEADDLADPDFLTEAVAAFQDPSVTLSYCQSRQMDENGDILCEHYLDYVADIDARRWMSPYVVPGQQEIVQALYLKNTIPNVSAVVFRREALLAVLQDSADEILSVRNVGDWLVYLRLLARDGAVAFSPRSLNSHRRHKNSVTVANSNMAHLQEILQLQCNTLSHFALGQEAWRKVDAYAQKLYIQFGLATEAHPRYDQHPELAPILATFREREAAVGPEGIGSR